MKPLAVVAVSHNSSAALEGWLDALEATGRRADMEVCIVDSGSSPAELAILERELGPRADVLRMLPNVGFGSACNSGAAATEAPLLLFTNPDTRVRALPGSVWNGAGLGGAIVGAMKLTEDGGRVPLAFRHLPSVRWEAEDLVLARWARTYERTVDRPAWVSGSALLVERRDFDAVHGFSPRFFMYFEDADLCARHVARGGTIRVDETLTVEHPGGQSSSDTDDFALESINRHSARTFAAFHGRRAYAPLLYVLMALAYVPRRVLLRLVRRGWSREEIGAAARFGADLLTPRRTLRRLGAANAPGPRN